MVIHYFKWDNIDTDSEDEPMLAQPAKPPNPPSPHQTPSQPSQASSSTTDKSFKDAQASSERIKAVIVRCNDDPAPGANWSAVTITSNHAIFEQQIDSEAPRPAALGIPLAFLPLPSSNFKKRPSSLDNQIITYMNIDLESGFAPMAWQSEVGTVHLLHGSI